MSWLNDFEFALRRKSLYRIVQHLITGRSARTMINNDDSLIPQP
jgi:hypothetical protein